MAAPSAQDLFDLAKGEAQARRTDLTFDDGDIAEMTGWMSAVVGDRIIGYVYERLKATYVDGASGDDLTVLADDHWSIVRTSAIKAIGAVTFTRSSGAISGTISTGTVVSTQPAADGSTVQFETTEDLNFTTELTLTADVQAVVAGVGGNVAAATVTRVVDGLFDTFTCTNASVMAGGTDAETDESLRERIREYSTTLRRATLSSLEYGAKQVAGVTYATAVEDAGGIVTVYYTDASGGSNANLTSLVLAELEDWRAAGVIVNASGGELYTLTPITLTLTCRAGVDTVQIAAAVKTAIVARLAKLKIGEVCSRSIIQQAALNVSDQILNCTVTAPATDVEPTATQLIRTTTGAITVA